MLEKKKKKEKKQINDEMRKKSIFGRKMLRKIHTDNDENVNG